MTQQTTTPAAITVELEEMDRKEEPRGFSARIVVGARTYRVSRLDGEDDWTIDAEIITATGYPVFVNGYGARYLRTSILTYVPAVETLNRGRFLLAEGQGRR